MEEMSMRDLLRAALPYVQRFVSGRELARRIEAAAANSGPSLVRFDVTEGQLELVLNALRMAERECRDLAVRCLRDQLWEQHNGRTEKADAEREAMGLAIEQADKYNAVRFAIQEQSAGTGDAAREWWVEPVGVPGPALGPFADELAASDAMDAAGLSDATHKLVWRP